MQRGIRPIYHPDRVTVLDRIEVDVVEMTLKILFVHDHVFPEPALPDAAFSFGGADIGTMFGLWQSTGESGFDARPAIRVVGVAFGQPPQAMQMLGQHHDGDYVEGSCSLSIAESSA